MPRLRPLLISAALRAASCFAAEVRKARSELSLAGELSISSSRNIGAVY